MIIKNKNTANLFVVTKSYALDMKLFKIFVFIVTEFVSLKSVNLNGLAKESTIISLTFFVFI